MYKKIMILGTCGFQLGNLIRKMIYDKLPYTFVSIDRVNENSINSIYWNKSHTFHISSINDQHVLDTIFKFEKPDIVIHGAENKSDDILSSNIIGTQNVINACLNNNIERLLYISSEKVYGEIKENDPFKLETDQLNPSDIYSVSKVAAENLVKLNGAKLNYNIIRMGNSYGPRQNRFRLIPKTINCILQNKPIEIYNQGQQLRDWLHVFDASTAIISILNNGKPNEVYNVSANQEFQDLEIVQKVCNSMNAGHNLMSFKNVDVPFRIGIDNSKIKELGWKPEFKFKDSIKSVIYWNETNKWFFR